MAEDKPPKSPAETSERQARVERSEQHVKLGESIGVNPAPSTDRPTVQARPSGTQDSPQPTNQQGGGQQNPAGGGGDTATGSGANNSGTDSGS